MKDILVIAFKNVLRNKRRSILNIVALGVGILLMLIFLGWTRGYFTNIYRSVINFETGHIQLLHKDYLDENERLPLDLTISDYTSVKQKLTEYQYVNEAAGRIEFSLKLSKSGESLWLAGRAIDPEAERKITVLDKYITEGKYLAKQKGLLVGKPLADRLGIKAGETLAVTAVDKYSVKNLSYIPVAGIFHFGYPKMDENIIYTDLETAGELLGMDNEVTKIVLALPGREYISHVLESLEEFTEDRPVTAYSWREFAEVVVTAVNQDSTSFAVIMGICFMLIILGILNSMSMSVHERTTEIGTLRAIGMKKPQLVYMLLAEAAVIGLIAAACSLVIGIPLAWYLQYVGFEMEGLMPENIPIPFGKRLTSDFRWWDYPLCTAIGVGTAVLGGIIPARRAVKLTIAKAMAKANLQ